MIRKYIKKFIDCWRLSQAEYDRDMYEWGESDPEGYYNFMEQSMEDEIEHLY